MPETTSGSLRPIRKRDLIQCQDIIYACLNMACENDDENIELRKYYSYSNLERFLISSKIFYVFEMKEKILGMGRISNRNEIMTLYVKPGYHRKGIGKEIIHKMEMFLKSDGRRKAYVRALTSAIGFYEKQGYSRAKNFEKRDNRMEKRLL